MTAHVAVAEPGRLYTVAETAELLRMHPHTLIDRRKQGRAPVAVKDGAKYLVFLGADINAYIRAQRETAA